jgi:hypothetical protein
VPKEHWIRVKALSGRLAIGSADECDTLKPVADLHRNLHNDIYVFLQNPVKWDGQEPKRRREAADLRSPRRTSGASTAYPSLRMRELLRLRDEFHVDSRRNVGIPMVRHLRV